MLITAVATALLVSAFHKLVARRCVGDLLEVYKEIGKSLYLCPAKFPPISG